MLTLVYILSRFTCNNKAIMCGGLGRFPNILGSEVQPTGSSNAVDEILSQEKDLKCAAIGATNQVKYVPPYLISIKTPP